MNPAEKAFPVGFIQPLGNFIRGREKFKMTHRKTLSALMLSILTGTIGCASSQKTSALVNVLNAKDLVRVALAAMGGEEKIRGLQSLRLEAKGSQKVLWQPDLAEGPWATLYQEVTEWRDLKNQRWRRDTNEWGFTTTSLVADSIAAVRQFNRTFSPDAPGAEEWLAIGPESILLHALAASDLHAESESALGKVPHHQVGFTWRGFPVRVFLHKYTHLPTAVKIIRPYLYGGDFFEIWGDVTTRIVYSKWVLRPDGVSYPMQMDIVHNDGPESSYNFIKVELNAPMQDSLFAIPEDVKAAYRTRLAARAKKAPSNRPTPVAIEIAPDIVQIKDGINATIVRQDEGLIIFEAPFSSEAHSGVDMVIEEAQRRFPNVPINAVIVTAYMWNYIGGVREYVARGIPVYGLDLYQPLLQRLVAAPHHTYPDSLARQPQAPIFRAVSAKTVIGQNRNRIELYPTRTTTERLIAYFPEHRLLYASDLAARAIAAPLSRGTVSQFLPDLLNAVKREKLEVDKAFSLHLPPFDWPIFAYAITPMAN
jgi:hypothetical protein